MKEIPILIFEVALLFIRVLLLEETKSIPYNILLFTVLFERILPVELYRYIPLLFQLMVLLVKVLLLAQRRTDCIKPVPAHRIAFKGVVAGLPYVESFKTGICDIIEYAITAGKCHGYPRSFELTLLLSKVWLLEDTRFVPLMLQFAVTFAMLPFTTYQ